MSHAAVTEFLRHHRSPSLDVSDIDWDAFTETAVKERLAPVLAERLRHAVDLPQNVHRSLTRERYNTGAYNHLLYRELARVLQAAPSDRPPVLLKGGALATTVYSDIAHRPMSDLDLLVPKADVRAWASHLEALGYESETPAMTSGLSEAVHYQLAFRGGPFGDIVIELHWNLVGGDSDVRAPDIDWFWRHTEPWLGLSDPACGSALQLTPEANVLYLSAHAMLQHGEAQARLLWLYDIQRVVAASERALDWELVVQKARAFGWSSAVRAALQRSVELFDTPVPPPVLAELDTDESPTLDRHVAHKRGRDVSVAAHVLGEMACLDVPAKCRLALSIVFPAPSYMKWRYPRARAVWPVTYPYRWLVVARHGFTHFARTLTNAFLFVFL